MGTTGDSNQTGGEESPTEPTGGSNQTGGEEESPTAPSGGSNQTSGEGSSKDVKGQLETAAGLIQDKMKSSGGFNQEELQSIMAQAGMAIAPNIEKFNELDTNK